MPEQEEECQLSVSDLSFSIAFTVLATFGLRGIFTGSPMATGAFMTLGSVLTFSPLMHSLVAQDLLVLSLRFTEPRFCWSEVMTPGILSGAPTR